MKSIIVGASAGLGRALAEELAAQKHDLYLISSDQRDLDALASDLTLTHGITVHTLAMDLVKADAEEIRNGFFLYFDHPDCLFLASDYRDQNDDGPVESSLLERIISVNFMASVQIANAFLTDLADRPQAHIVGIGSFTAFRGRCKDSIYEASKRGLEFYFEALRHYLADNTCRVQFYRVGYMATQMLGERKALVPVAPPERIARAIANRLGGASGMRYLPGWWRWGLRAFVLSPRH
jgi:short-subunit dehydrogenase